MYSRGKAHILRLAVSVHLLLEFWELYQNGETQEDDHLEHTTEQPNNEEDTIENHTAPHEDGNLSTEGATEEDVPLSEPENQEDNEEQCILIGTKPIEVASSIVSTCLTQLCKFY